MNVRADYQTLDVLSRALDSMAEETEAVAAALQREMMALETGWIGRSADAFAAEMQGVVLPLLRDQRDTCLDFAAGIRYVVALFQYTDDGIRGRFATGGAATGGTVDEQAAMYVSAGGDTNIEDTAHVLAYNPTERPDGLFFFTQTGRMFWPFAGIDTQFDSLDAYVAAGGSLTDANGNPITFVNIAGVFYGRDGLGGSIVRINHPDAFVEQSPGVWVLKPGLDAATLQSITLTVAHDGNICGPAVIAAAANWMFGLTGDERITPGAALMDLIGIWQDPNSPILNDVTLEGITGTVGRDPSEPTFMFDLSALASSYGMQLELMPNFANQSAGAVYDAMLTELDQGNLIIGVVNIDDAGLVYPNPDPDGEFTNHWVVVDSVRTDENGQRWVRMYNPYNNQVEYYTLEDFQRSFYAGNGGTAFATLSDPNATPIPPGDRSIDSQEPVVDVTDERPR
jgi:uncharacterized protein YukE